MNAFESLAANEASALKVWLLGHYKTFAGGLVIGFAAGWLLAKIF